MDQSLPSFRNPPVIETAVSVQFQPIKGFSNAHLGLFWRELRSEFPKLRDAGPIEPQIEKFGSGRPTARFPMLKVAASQPAARIWMMADDGHTMVQLQNGRLVYNWRRLDDGEYPRWQQVEPGFQTAFTRLERFLDSEGLGQIEPNQWEVTYVNHLLRGRDWDEPADLPEILPGLIGSTDRVCSASFESVDSHYQFVLPDDAGRLHVELSHGFSGSDEGAPELLVLQLTARGGIEPDGRGLSEGITLGRECVVRTFSEVTGKSVHETWEREA